MTEDHTEGKQSLFTDTDAVSQGRPASGSRDGFYTECPDCGYDDANCMCDENTPDDRWLEDEEARERLADEDRFLYGM